MQIDLVKEKTAKEQMDEAKKTGHGIIIPTIHVIGGTNGDDLGSRFDIGMGDGMKLFFMFTGAKQRVHFDLEPVLQEAYRLAMEE